MQISDYGQLPDGTAYIVMEYLPGETLARRLTRVGARLPLSDILQITWQLADSLASAHQKGVIHRDLKPGNVMLGWGLLWDSLGRAEDLQCGHFLGELLNQKGQGRRKCA